MNNTHRFAYTIITIYTYIYLYTHIYIVLYHLPISIPISKLISISIGCLILGLLSDRTDVVLPLISILYPIILQLFLYYTLSYALPSLGYRGQVPVPLAHRSTASLSQCTHYDLMIELEWICTPLPFPWLISHACMWCHRCDGSRGPCTSRILPVIAVLLYIFWWGNALG